MFLFETGLNQSTPVQEFTMRTSELPRAWCLFQGWVLLWRNLFIVCPLSS